MDARRRHRNWDCGCQIGARRCGGGREAVDLGCRRDASPAASAAGGSSAAGAHGRGAGCVAGRGGCAGGRLGGRIASSSASRGAIIAQKTARCAAREAAKGGGGRRRHGKRHASGSGCGWGWRGVRGKGHGGRVVVRRSKQLRGGGCRVLVHQLGRLAANNEIALSGGLCLCRCHCSSRCRGVDDAGGREQPREAQRVAVAGRRQEQPGRALGAADSGRSIVEDVCKRSAPVEGGRRKALKRQAAVQRKGRIGCEGRCPIKRGLAGQQCIGSGCMRVGAVRSHGAKVHETGAGAAAGVLAGARRPRRE
eukprot:m.93612 g.93612  ORF g.93612 m.93612 type:complete len:308 (-) comp8694_c1_seq1:127-1050(-)